MANIQRLAKSNILPPANTPRRYHTGVCAETHLDPTGARGVTTKYFPGIPFFVVPS